MNYQNRLLPLYHTFSSALSLGALDISYIVQILDPVLFVGKSGGVNMSRSSRRKINILFAHALFRCQPQNIDQDFGDQRGLVLGVTLRPRLALDFQEGAL